ncbi:WXG100 family type VII secretion target [Rossellomorea aquimaris]|uniref:WXG100 family type VII secretion target n=1 Tax=Rossellomorea aquimaris TaxID=189382 RepID=UPI001CD7705B|nr:WXG100 family type VII secretion target [Rossellomorea aquimaris]MCA1054932.1 WXG100 family type VII secretion target [Rossellomorea aquimaris]
MKKQVADLALSYERNTDLAFDTTALKEYGNRYAHIAQDLREMSKKLDNSLVDLNASGWTTPAGSAFHKMVNANWRDNIEKYAALLDTLKDILDAASKEYDDLVENHIERTKI